MTARIQHNRPFPFARARARCAAALVVLALPLLARVASASDGYIPITGANFKPLPLAVAPFAGPAPHAGTLTAALNEDLAFTGLFELLDPRSFLAPPTEGLTTSAIDFSKWRAVGADSLVKASLSGTAEALKVEFRLFDVLGGKEAARLSLSGSAADLRAWAHQWADLLYEHFTGDKGIFRTRVAWVRRSGGSKQLFVADFDGRNGRAFTAPGGLDLLPSWSPDGRSLAFTSYRTGVPMLHLLDVASGAVRALGPRGELQTGAAFSPDGQRIAFTMSVNGNSDVWVCDRDGKNMRPLTEARDSDSSPTWSPDSKRVAFVSTRSGGPQIFAMNADGTGVERLTFQGNYNQTPDWSPRGDLIAFTARDERRMFDIFAVNPATKKIQRLTQDQGDNEEPSFSPNGRHIVFVSTREGGRKRLWVMNADGTNQRPLAAEGEGGTPAWGPWPD